MSVKFLDLEKQYRSIQQDIDHAVADVIRDTAFVGGKYVKLFEEAFAAYQNAPYCVGVGNGTDALEISIEALCLPAGSTILVPANSFIASAEAVTRAGHKVVFCDCDPNNYTIDTEKIRQKMTADVKALMAVHLYGHPCDMDPLIRLAEEHGLKIIEDCAQAHGAEYKGKRVGTIGDIGAFSFYPGKNLGAYGDGGAILASDEETARRCRMIANHGRLEKYRHEFEGRNSRLDGIQAAILSAKLRHLDQWTERRIQIADRYLDGLRGRGGTILPRCESWAKQVYHLFVIRSPYRDELRDYLKEREIAVGIHYPVALPKLEAYAYTGQAGEAFFANRADSELLSLPIGDHLDDDEVDTVIQAVNDFGSEQ
jgi:dTDP-4-amino-4,6-dideoxygalactose transaminase